MEESDDGIVNLSSFTLGYFPDQQEQLVSGKRISYVANLAVDDLLFVFDSSSQRGSGNVFVDIPLHSGSYRVYLIEDTVRNLQMDEYMKEVGHLVSPIVILRRAKGPTKDLKIDSSALRASE